MEEIGCDILRLRELTKEDTSPSGNSSSANLAKLEKTRNQFEQDVARIGEQIEQLAARFT
jgi:hypothetical protein